MAETFALRQENFRPSAASAVDGFATRIGSLAIRALYRELALSRKPGLVSPTDSGSHQDMDFHTFMRSLESLRDYFPEITRVGAASPSFEPLRQLGVAAEAKMLQATGGINTHRGAIFNIGLLCAAAGAMHAEGRRLSAADVCAEAARRWGGAIEAAANPASHSHGAEMARRYGSGGARREAADGFLRRSTWGYPPTGRLSAGPPIPSGRRCNAYSHSSLTSKTRIFCGAAVRKGWPSPSGMRWNFSPSVA